MNQRSYSHKVIDGVKKSIHRHVMEIHLGRELGHDEHVYHMNGDCRDNRIENLVLVKKTYNRPMKQKKKTRFQIVEDEINEIKKRLNFLEEKNG